MTPKCCMTPAERRVARDEVGDSDVSTVFLQLDHSFTGRPPPLVFETMVFGGPLDGECERYATWDEAEMGHARMIARVRSTDNEPEPSGEPSP